MLFSSPCPIYPIKPAIDIIKIGISKTISPIICTLAFIITSLFDFIAPPHTLYLLFITLQL